MGVCFNLRKMTKRWRESVFLCGYIEEEADCNTVTKVSDGALYLCRLANSGAKISQGPNCLCSPFDAIHSDQKKTKKQETS